MNNAPWPFDPTARDGEEPSSGEMFRFYIDRRQWREAAQHVHDGDWLTLDNEEAFFLAAHLPDGLRLDHGEGSDWHVVREGTVCSW